MSGKGLYDLRRIPGPQETVLSGPGAYKNKASLGSIDLASTFPEKLCWVFNITMYTRVPGNLTRRSTVEPASRGNHHKSQEAIGFFFEFLSYGFNTQPRLAANFRASCVILHVPY